MTAYYNEFDPFAANWLRNLIAAGHIAPGDVDERDIRDVPPIDLVGYTQCHFFAGIGGWSYALRLAGWPDDRPCWTGSCPCQPFSAAGSGKGFDDERHLWPAFHWLISQLQPDIIFGEQVAGSAGRAWLDLVYDDMEAISYAVGAVDIPACSVGAPHKRARHYWLAESPSIRRRRGSDGDSGGIGGQIQVEGRGASGFLADAGGQIRKGWASNEPRRSCQTCREWECRNSGVNCPDGAVADTGRGSLEHNGHTRGNQNPAVSPQEKAPQWEWGGDIGRGGGADGSDVILCTDGKARIIPAESAFFPLVDGLPPGGLGILRGSGNAIVPQLAAEFVGAYMELEGCC